MLIIETVAAMQDYVQDIRQRGQTIALVPTMGYLHEGHLSLMRTGKQMADHLVISIFVNPTQFAPNEDLDNYPRDMQRDTDLAESVGVDCIFFPPPAEMYPAGYSTYVNVEGLSGGLCGKSRPTHFRGVTTVVAKLFNICQPDLAVFGQKDFQQLVVIERMVSDLNMNLSIVRGPTVREEDGLAMSSRNRYLSTEERRQALVLNQALTAARQRFAAGEHNAATLTKLMRDMIATSPLARIDYVELVGSDDLQPVETITREAVIALAVRFGATRLIDNTILEA